MTILTRAEFDRQCEISLEFDRIDYNFQGFDEVRRSFTQWSDDSYKWAEFASGVHLGLFDEAIYRDYSIKNKHDEFQMLVSKFYLSGHHAVVSPGIENVEAEYLEKAGQNYLFYLPNIKEIEQSFAGTSMQEVRIHLDLNFLRSFVSKLDDVPQQLRPLIEQDDAPRFHRSVGKVTPMMRTIIKQMWQHPYQSAIRRSLPLRDRPYLFRRESLGTISNAAFSISRIRTV
ncbi:Regulatory protein (fragment) [Hyella patelloides LEGE 07179]|uniref:Regulatory protein n=1 Tax=Hyella patelloides LEGE 07179 TaxID=945734 RepID=A0A563W5C8_9CYAN